MATQTHTAALHPLKTVKLSGVSLASATLRATLRAALVAAPYSMSGADADTLLNRVKHVTFKVEAGPIHMSDAGDGFAPGTASADDMPYAAGEKHFITNCKELLGLAKIFAAGAYDVRTELYS